MLGNKLETLLNLPTLTDKLLGKFARVLKCVLVTLIKEWKSQLCWSGTYLMLSTRQNASVLLRALLHLYWGCRADVIVDNVICNEINLVKCILFALIVLEMCLGLDWSPAERTVKWATGGEAQTEDTGRQGKSKESNFNSRQQSYTGGRWVLAKSRK